MGHRYHLTFHERRNRLRLRRVRSVFQEMQYVGPFIDGKDQSGELGQAHGLQHKATGSWGVIHADHGSQFTAWAFTQKLEQYGPRLSLGTVGDCCDNAMIEAFGGRMQVGV